MAKLSPSDILTILRDFRQINESVTPRDVKRLQSTKPSDHTTITNFFINKQQFFVVSDVTAEDDAAYLRRIIAETWPNLSLQLHSNPNSADSFGLPYKGKDVYLLEAKKSSIRLDSYLAEHSPDISRSVWQTYIKTGHVMVDGITVTVPKTLIEVGTAIQADIPKAPDYRNKTLPVLYEDTNVIVVNKPVGVLTHSKGVMSDEFTVADFFRPRTSFATDTNRPGIVHRLDRDTSGVLIGAKTSEAAQLLQRQFSQRRVKKTYLALVDGVPKQPVARLELPIARHPANPSTFRVDAQGKMAVTSYRVLASYDGHSLIELRPTTGRTHQLRVHMAYLGTPIHGDRVYGQSSDRLYLHARDLELTLLDGQRHIFHALMPAEFERYLRGCSA